MAPKRKRPEEPSVLDFISCPVCYTTMMPPIRQCSSGHPFCDSCCRQLLKSSATSKCPMCKCALLCPVPRALPLEQLAASTEVSCDLDCGATFTYSAFEAHKEACAARTVPCLSSRCAWRGLPSKLRDHLAASPEAPEAPEDPSSSPSTLAASSRPHKPGHGLHSSRSSSTIFCLDFETRRGPGEPKRWRPGRRLVSLTRRGVRDSVDFCVALWKPEGAGQPVVCAVQLLYAPPGEEQHWGAVLELASPNGSYASRCEMPKTNCLARGGAAANKAAAEFEPDVWVRPDTLGACTGPTLVVAPAMLTYFNTAPPTLDPAADNSAGKGRPVRQRFSLNVRFTYSGPRWTQQDHTDPDGGGRNGASSLSRFSSRRSRAPHRSSTLDDDSIPPLVDAHDGDSDDDDLTPVYSWSGDSSDYGSDGDGDGEDGEEDEELSSITSATASTVHSELASDHPAYSAHGARSPHSRHTAYHDFFEAGLASWRRTRAQRHSRDLSRRTRMDDHVSLPDFRRENPLPGERPFRAPARYTEHEGL